VGSISRNRWLTIERLMAPELMPNAFASRLQVQDHVGGTIPLDEFERVLEVSTELLNNHSLDELFCLVKQVVPLAESELGEDHKITRGWLLTANMPNID